MTISAVLVNFNSGDTILQAIQSLIEQGNVWDEIVVVDNGSSDGSDDEIENRYPFTQVIRLNHNSGASYARNVGLAAIQSDYVLFMDDDVYLAPGGIQKMMAALRETGASVVCPRVILHPENHIVQCDGAAIHFMGVLALHHSFEDVASLSVGRITVTGFISACILCDAKLLRGLDGFDDDYFIYFDDMELSYRLSSLGHKICCDANVWALHERGHGTENLSFRGQGVYPARRAYLTIRHRWLTVMIHYQFRTILLLFPAFVVYEIAAFVEIVLRNWLKEYLAAFFSLARAMPSIKRKRARWQSERKVLDRDILSGGPLPFSRGFVEDGGKKKLVVVLDTLLNFYWEKIKRWL